MATQDYDFSTPGEYSYDVLKIEVTGGGAKLKDQRPADATFYAGYGADVNGDWGDGVLSGTPVGGAAVSGGELDLAHNDVRYVDYDAVGNADSQQTGCIRFRIRPNYTGGPAGNRAFFSISNTAGSAANLIDMRHFPGGVSVISIFDSAGLGLLNLINGWSPVAGTVYEIEIDWDVTAGATRLFIDGAQAGATNTATGARDGNINLFRLGSDRTGADSSNFEISDFLYFSSVQHTANYTPDWSNIGDTIYSTDGPAIVGDSGIEGSSLDGMVETVVKAGSDNVKYAWVRNGTDVWWDGAAWSNADGTVANSNSVAEVLTNKAGLMLCALTLKPKIFLISDDGTTTPQIDNLQMEYTPCAVPILDPMGSVGIWGHG